MPPKPAAAEAAAAVATAHRQLMAALLLFRNLSGGLGHVRPRLVEAGTLEVLLEFLGGRVAAAEADARSIALMPCCYSQTAADAPEALRRALGVPLASDVHRTYRLEKLGYTVRWSAVPLSITPMNRIIIATR